MIAVPFLEKSILFWVTKSSGSLGLLGKVNKYCGGKSSRLPPLALWGKLFNNFASVQYSLAVVDENLYVIEVYFNKKTSIF